MASKFETSLQLPQVCTAEQGIVISLHIYLLILFKMEQNLSINYTVLNISSEGEIRNLIANFFILTLRMYCRNKTSCKQYIRDASFSLQVKIETKLSSL